MAIGGWIGIWMDTLDTTALARTAMPTMMATKYWASWKHLLLLSFSDPTGFNWNGSHVSLEPKQMNTVNIHGCKPHTHPPTHTHTHTHAVGLFPLVRFYLAKCLSL